MAANACLKNEFTEDEKCHNLMSWLNYVDVVCFHFQTKHNKRKKEWIMYGAAQFCQRQNERGNIHSLYEPRHEKTCLRDLRPFKTQTSLLSWWDWLGSWNFRYSKSSYTIQAVNIKGTYQTVRVYRLICAFVVRIWHKQVFSWHGSIIN